MSHRYFTSTDRRLGVVVAFAAFYCAVAYAIVLTLGLLTLASPTAPIADPYFTIMEVLIVILAPLLVVLMVTVHQYASSVDRVYSLTALAFMLVLCGITCSVHGIVLMVSRHPAFAAISPVFFAFSWPSVSYALDILAWDLFFGLSMLFAALVFKGDRLSIWLRITMLASGALSLAGLLAVPLGDMQLRWIGVVGYAGLSPVAFIMLANLFRQTHRNP